MTGTRPLFGAPQTEQTSDDYYTPKWIFDALDIRFDLDVAAPPGGSLVPCDRYYTKADDGLTSPWYGTVWMNPPFSEATPWTNRWFDHGDGIALLPAAKSRWFVSMWSNPSVTIAVLPSDLRFSNGQTISPVCVLAGIGPRAGAVAAVGPARKVTT